MTMDQQGGTRGAASAIGDRSATARSHAIPDRASAFRTAQARALARYGVTAESLMVDVPAIGGQAHVLKAGVGPPLVLVIGGTVPAAMWAPLIGQLNDRTVYAMDLPGFGLTDPLAYRTATMRRDTVAFLAQTLDALDVRRSQFVTSSQGSLWTIWLGLEQPDRVACQVQIGCTAHVLGTTAPGPMRAMSVGPVGRFLLGARPPSTAQVEQVGRMVGEDLASVPELRDALLACERLPSYADSMLGLMRAVMRLGRARAEIALGPADLRRVAHPNQLQWGERDPFGSVDVGRRVADCLPQAELHVLPGGHAPWFQNAELVAGLARRFLGEHPA